MDREPILKLLEQLGALCRRPLGAPDTFERICTLTRWIQDCAETPLIAGLALEVRFKSEDVYRRPHLMPEGVLRQMLDDKLRLLEATVRANAAPVERRSAGNLGRRASDRATAAAIPATL